MRFARYLVVGLVAVGGLTACDHSSRHGAPYTTQQVQHAFATAGIVLEPHPTFHPSGVPSLRATLHTSDDSIQVIVYKIAVSKIAPSKQIGFITLVLNGEQSTEERTFRNVAMNYPRDSRPKIRRAVRVLGRQ